MRSSLFPDTDRARIAEELKAASRQGLKTSLAENESIAYPLDTDGNKIYGDTVRSNNLFVFGQSGRCKPAGCIYRPCLSSNAFSGPLYRLADRI